MKPSIALLVFTATLLASCETGRPGPSSPVGSNGSVRSYPLITCLVCDEVLDEDTREVTQVHGGQEVKFCSAGCQQRFRAAPARHLAGLPRVP